MRSTPPSPSPPSTSAPHSTSAGTRLGPAATVTPATVPSASSASTQKEDFSRTWAKLWREDCDLGTLPWLTKMHEDGCMDSLVARVTVPVPIRRISYLMELERMAAGIASLPPVPEMRLAGCWGLSPCPFTSVCPGTDPEQWGFRLRPAALPRIIHLTQLANWRRVASWPNENILSPLISGTST